MDQPADNQAQFAYWATRDQALDHERCFLCGVFISDENSSEEHVFPKWLLRRFDLFNEFLNLPNGRGVRYGSLTIPCCKECNNQHLNPLETEMATAVKAGPMAVEAIGSLRVGLWMAKIYYGLLFNDLGVPMETRKPDGETLMTPDALESAANLHHILQLLRGKLRLADEREPSSVFVFETIDCEDTKMRFDFRDILVAPFLGIRMGPVGIVCSLLDWSAVAEALESPTISAAKQMVLHPTQFNEVAANIAYWRVQFNRTPKHIVQAGDEGADTLFTLPIGGISALPVFDDFDPEVLVPLLSGFMGYQPEQVWNPETQAFWTTLKRDNGELLQVDTCRVGFMPPSAL